MKRNHFVFCGFFYGNVDLSDQFEECLWFACSTFYRKCVMQCGTRTGLVLVLTRSRPALVLVLTRSRPALVLVLTWSRPLKVLVLSRSRYTLVLVMTWSRFRWSWLQHCDRAVHSCLWRSTFLQISRSLSVEWGVFVRFGEKTYRTVDLQEQDCAALLYEN